MDDVGSGEKLELDQAAASINATLSERQQAKKLFSLTCILWPFSHPVMPSAEGHKFEK